MKAIITKYHGPTNTRGSRITATDGDNRISLSMDDALNHDANHDAAAAALCRKLKWGQCRLMRGEVRYKGEYITVYTFARECNVLEVSA